MNLLIFDIDGTLTRTDFIDHKIFLEVFREKISSEITSLGDFKLQYNTDNGDTHELFKIIHHREPSPLELQDIIQTVVNKFRQSALESPHYFEAVSGAPDLFRYFREEGSKQWHTAIATGCWHDSAIFKLGKSALAHQQMPLATSDGLFSKAEIIQDAVSKSKAVYQIENYEKIVYIGDSINDLNASLQLGIRFIGIQAENNAGKKKLLGDYCLLENFCNIDLIKHLISSN